MILRPSYDHISILYNVLFTLLSCFSYMYIIISITPIYIIYKYHINIKYSHVGFVFFSLFY